MYEIFMQLQSSVYAKEVLYRMQMNAIESILIWTLVA